MSAARTQIYTNLYTYFDQIEIVDSHEHLPSEQYRTNASVDFTTLFSHYCMAEMVSAGLRSEGLRVIQDPGAAISAKWQAFAPYYERIKNGGYCRAARIAMQKFYGVADLASVDDAEVVTERIRQANVPGLYQRILKDTCHLKNIFIFTNDFYDPDYFKFVDCVDHLCGLNNLTELENAARETGGAYHTLRQYVDAVISYIQRKAEQGVKGIKFTCAYYRSLDFKPVTFAEAENVFNRMLSTPYLINNRLPRSIDNADAMVLHDFLTLRVLDACDQLGLPAVFHTGLLADSRNNPVNANPLPLWRLFYTYPTVNFILLHGGLPWTGEVTMLAKGYPNVYVDMAWMHIISPEISVSALKTWVDMLPRNKVLGFGGDYFVVEKVYGHLTMAKENICRALSEKITARAMTEDEAVSWIDHLMRLNASQIYRLD